MLPVQNRVVQHFQFAQFTDEFNIAQHLPLGHKSRLLFIVAELSGSLLVSRGNSSSIFKLILAFAKQQSLKGGNLTVCRFKVWGVLIESLAQLCIHGTVLRFIESFFEDLELEIIKNQRNTIVWYELTSKITPLKIVFDPCPMILSMSLINFSNFSGVILLRIPRTLRKTKSLWICSLSWGSASRLAEGAIHLC